MRICGVPVGAPKQDRPLKMGDEEAIVVFTGGTGRIYTAKKLMTNGFDGPVLISGVNERVHPKKVLGDLFTTYSGDVTYDYESSSTRGNVSMTTDWVHDKGIKSITLVTSYYHMPRSLLLLKQAGFSAKIQPFPVFPRTIGAIFLLREYTKYLIAYTRIF
jgi:uncharacterized SAM-binding protein YcdF (DUF218 family)